jgi:beta-N-acetylhexosaminidase
VVLFARNVESPRQLAQLNGDLQRTVKANGDAGLIISIDQEGGRIARLRKETGFAEFPSAQSVGASSDPTGAARQIARAMATEMKAAGINMNLAPVLDVNNNPANPVIGDRSFGADPALVAACGVAFIETLQTEGIMAVGKHFPGHGDTTVDSHVALPVVPHDRARLESVEFAPFKAAIRAGVAGIMSAHISFPAIDSTPNLAATLSRKVMTDLLRDELKFGGIRMTDSLEMGALQTSGYPVPVAAITALQAGADLLLFNCGHAMNRQAHAAIVDAARRGEIPSARLDEAVRRVLIAKERFGVLNLPA